jgi:hypothetical protein
MNKKQLQNAAIFSCWLLICIGFGCSSNKSFRENPSGARIINVDTGWAGNSVNTTIFRKNSLTSLRDTQFISFYDPGGFVVLGKRKIGESKWELQRTKYKGKISDAHNSISIIVDDDGYLHMAWDHHNNRLHYAKSIAPGSLQLTAEMPMASSPENSVTYPEFYRLPGGELLFFYRDGSSGNGNLIINKYNLQTKQWSALQSNLINGEGKRNAYWQACVDVDGTIHISWVWRETPDVASNHDLCYARSRDGGKTWERSTGEKYVLPITASTAEIACRIPQNSQLINQTSMCTDGMGAPFIASYWCDEGTTVPQYHVVYNLGQSWQVKNLGFRKTSFSLSGTGTKRIPISRPQIIARQLNGLLAVYVIFRDAERDNKVSVAWCGDLTADKCVIKDIYNEDVGSWEPTYDTDLWRDKGILHLFIQRTEQADGEGKTNMPPQIVRVLEW